MNLSGKEIHLFRAILLHGDIASALRRACLHSQPERQEVSGPYKKLKKFAYFDTI